MRSGLIFAISEKVSNRYMLCRMLAASARKMHRDGVSISQSINRSLQVLNQSPVATSQPSAMVAPQISPVEEPAAKVSETETGALVP